MIVETSHELSAIAKVMCIGVLLQGRRIVWAAVWLGREARAWHRNRRQRQRVCQAAKVKATSVTSTCAVDRRVAARSAALVHNFVYISHGIQVSCAGRCSSALVSRIKQKFTYRSDLSSCLRQRHALHASVLLLRHTGHAAFASFLQPWSQASSRPFSDINAARTLRCLRSAVRPSFRRLAMLGASRNA